MDVVRVKLWKRFAVVLMAGFNAIILGYKNLSPIYAMFHLFGRNALIQLNGLTYYRKNSSE